MMRKEESCASILMEADARRAPLSDVALTPLSPGSRLQIRYGALVVDIEPYPRVFLLEWLK